MTTDLTPLAAPALPQVSEAKTEKLAERIKRTVASRFPEYVDNYFGPEGYDPVVYLALRSIDAPDDKMRIQCAIEVAKYTNIQTKAMEITGKDGQPIQTQNKTLDALLLFAEQAVRSRMTKEE